MHSKNAEYFNVLKKGIETESFLIGINHNEKTQAEFIANLEQNELAPEQLLELINIVKDKQVKSLIILHLLSLKGYFERLKGESILARLDKKGHLPSRLNALIHEIDVRTLTRINIGYLQREAAVSLLCSIPHFHQLNKNQIYTLLQMTPDSFLNYWVTHFATMPNSHFMLAHFSELRNFEMSDALKQLEPTKREDIITIMIQHLNLFNPEDTVLQDKNIEARLHLAIHLVHKGHKDLVYVNYINKLTEQLLRENSQLAPLTIQLLISLYSKPEFNELKIKTSHHINTYLRINAEKGNADLFYDSGRMNISSMSQTLDLNPTVYNPSNLTKFLTNLLSNDPTPTTTTIPENSLIEVLKQRNAAVRAIDYFLIHFKGSSIRLSQLISAYLNYHIKEGGLEKPSQSIYHLSILMNKDQLDSSVREAIFNTLLLYPSLFDEQICGSLLRYDAKRAIQHFGLQGGEENYNRVIQLCSNGLKKLAPEEHETKKKVTTALKEAQIELNFLKNSGFFSRLFDRFQRCWVYGWTGLLYPNSPTYVLRSNEKGAPKHNIAQPYTPLKPLPTLLAELKDTILTETATLNGIIEALESYSLEAEPKNELETRRTIHLLFHKLLTDNKSNKGLENWLMKKQNPLIMNRIRFLALLFEQGHEAKLVSTIKEIKADSTHLQLLTNEFNCPLPELSPPAPTKNEPVPEEGIIASATELVSTATGYVSAATAIASKWMPSLPGLGSFFATNPEPEAVTKAPPTTATTGPN